MQPHHGNQFTFVHESMVDDIDLFLGPLEPGEKETVVVFNDMDWSDVAVSVGIFPSKGQSRKNGWSGEIPTGLVNRQQKKGKFIKKDIWILNRI